MGKGLNKCKESKIQIGQMWSVYLSYMLSDIVYDAIISWRFNYFCERSNMQNIYQTLIWKYLMFNSSIVNCVQLDEKSLTNINLMNVKQLH